MWRLKDVLLKPVTCIYYGTDQQFLPRTIIKSLRWRHNDHDSVSNHQPHGCLLNRLFRRRSKKTSKLRVTGLCVGNSPGPVNSPHKGPVTRKMFPFDDVIMTIIYPYRLLTVGLIIFDRKVSRVSDDNVLEQWHMPLCRLLKTRCLHWMLCVFTYPVWLHLIALVASITMLANNHTVLKKWNYSNNFGCRAEKRNILEKKRVGLLFVALPGWVGMTYYGEVKSSWKFGCMVSVQ